MRDLTIKQKTLLKKWHTEREAQKNPFNSVESIFSCDDLTENQYTLLEKLNNTEVLYQNCNRFLGDLN